MTSLWQLISVGEGVHLIRLNLNTGKDFVEVDSKYSKKDKMGGSFQSGGFFQEQNKPVCFFLGWNKRTSVPWLALPESWAGSTPDLSSCPAVPLAPSWGLVASRSTLSDAIACSCVAFSSTLPVRRRNVQIESTLSWFWPHHRATGLSCGSSAARDRAWNGSQRGGQGYSYDSCGHLRQPQLLTLQLQLLQPKMTGCKKKMLFGIDILI